jgi:hypothetical protein
VVRTPKRTLLKSSYKQKVDNSRYVKSSTGIPPSCSVDLSWIVDREITLAPRLESRVWKVLKVSRKHIGAAEFRFVSRKR